MALFTWVQHLCTFNILSPYSSPFVKCLEGVVHHQRVHLCWCSVLTSNYKFSPVENILPVETLKTIVTLVATENLETAGSLETAGILGDCWGPWRLLGPRRLLWPPRRLLWPPLEAILTLKFSDLGGYSDLEV